MPNSESKHVHRVLHWPRTTNGTGYGVCDCGATVRIESGQIKGGWHTCALCTHAYGRAS